MSLATYSDLQTAVGAELNRSDLSGVIPDLITRFEAKARRALREWLRTSITATNVTADYALPATVGDVLSVNVNDGINGAHNYAMDLIDKTTYQSFLEAEAFASVTPGQLCYVDFDADAPSTTLRFWPPATASGPIANLKVEYIKILPALSATQTTNALLREAPDAYVYGALTESAAYLMHDERIPIWEGRVKDALRELRILTERRLYGGAPRRILLPRVFG